MIIFIVLGFSESQVNGIVFHKNQLRTACLFLFFIHFHVLHQNLTPIPNIVLVMSLLKIPSVLQKQQPFLQYCLISRYELFCLTLLLGSAFDDY